MDSSETSEVQTASQQWTIYMYENADKACATKSAVLGFGLHGLGLKRGVGGPD